jgi:hypothetical protein
MGDVKFQQGDEDGYEKVFGTGDGDRSFGRLRE